MSKESWDRFFIDMAHLVAKKSKDSTKVGAVLVGPHNEVRSVGFNGFPKGTNDDIPCRHERPLKYSFTSHGERNSIYQAARAGISTDGCTLYMNWSPTPCVDCAKAVIQSGIVEVVGPDRPFVSPSSLNRKDWEADFEVTRQMFSESGIWMRVFPGWEPS